LIFIYLVDNEFIYFLINIEFEGI